MTREVFTRFRKVFTNTELHLDLRVRFAKYYVWPVLPYDVEIFKVTVMEKLETFETWIYHRILKIQWTAKVTNMEILRRIARDRELLKVIKRKKIVFLGHVMW
ncbi:hypothetical protein ACFW04_013998 [Cataglyphis niger]